jgi:hypothetical protein
VPDARWALLRFVLEAGKVAGRFARPLPVTPRLDGPVTRPKVDTNWRDAPGPIVNSSALSRFHPRVNHDLWMELN